MATIHAVWHRTEINYGGMHALGFTTLRRIATSHITPPGSSVLPTEPITPAFLRAPRAPL